MRSKIFSGILRVGKLCIIRACLLLYFKENKVQGTMKSEANCGTQKHEHPNSYVYVRGGGGFGLFVLPCLLQHFYFYFYFVSNNTCVCVDIVGGYFVFDPVYLVYNCGYR